MLDLSTIDLEEVAIALDDHSYQHGWWVDADTGEVWLWSRDGDDDPQLDPDLRPGARFIEPLPPNVGYEDMEDFIARVPDRRAADLLDPAIAGKGAFRRFKDTILEFPDLRREWSRFRETRMRRRAIEFLVDEGLVETTKADAALSELDDEPVGDNTGASDPRHVAEAVAADLHQLYGGRLVDVVLYGSRARGDARPGSDVDLAVILEDVSSSWEELRRMDHVLWRHTLERGLTVSAIPISVTAWTEAQRPLVMTAKAEGFPIG